MATVRSDKELQEEEHKLKEEIEKKHGKSVEQLYEEREKRYRDAIELKVPDRVPVTVGTGIFAARYAGLTASAQYYDHDAFREACKKVALDFEPDSGVGTAAVSGGLVMELLDARNQRWPGGNLPEDAPYQFVEGEYMTVDEYDHFLSDPSDFVFRYYLPRINGVLEPLTKLPPFRTMVGGTGFTAVLGLLNRPEFKQMAVKLAKAAEEQERVRKEGLEFSEQMARLGFPSQQLQGGGGIFLAPFDTISDNLRGMRGSMIDMYRCPDKLLVACDKILEWQSARAAPANPKTRGNPKTQFMPLHRGSDGFMSLKQFEKFYWPTLKKAILHNISLGYVVAAFWEGIWDQRLEYLLDLPKGKVIFWCEKTDIFKAKQLLGNHMCIQGGVPPTLLEVGSTQEVEEHCKKLIATVGKGGGYIMGAGSAIDCARPANVMAMVDSVKKYGWY